jgi:hypothetical protein
MLMREENKLDLLIIGIPVLVILSLLLVSEVKFGVALSPQEQALLDFRSESLPRMVQRNPPALARVASPIPLVMASEKDYPQELLGDIAPAEGGGPTEERQLAVSLIVVGRGKKLAIIGGVVTREGDVIDRQRVVRIERDKVLLKDKEGERWLRLD